MRQEERICTRCNGKGKVTCPSCQGSRMTIMRMVFNEIPQDVPVPCHRCGGTGSIECDRCYGRGKL